MTTSTLEPRLPVISGDRVFLSTLRREDVPQYVRWFNNLEYTTYLGATGFAATLEDEEGWYERASKRSDTQVSFTIVVAETEQSIGNVSLMDINHRHGIATLGIGIGDPAAWGKGYGSEAVRLMVQYGFYFLNLWNIELHHFAFNERGHRAYLKAGFREVGRRRGAAVLGGQRYDDVLMDITRDEVDLSTMRSMIKLIDA
jgi:RimJ/RimL family protein N-acetyltransferase